MKNNLKLKRALAAFSIALLLMSNTAPVLSDVAATISSSEQTANVETASVDTTTDTGTVETTDTTETIETTVEQVEGTISSTEESSSSSEESTSSEESSSSESDSSSVEVIPPVDPSEPEPSQEETPDSTTSESTSSSSETIDFSTNSSESSSHNNNGNSGQQKPTESTKQPEKQKEDKKNQPPKKQEEKKVAKKQPKESTPVTKEQKNQVTANNSIPSNQVLPNTPLFIGPSISDSKTSLDSRLVTNNISSSDLNGYELPLLDSFKDQRSAALVVEALSQLQAEYKKDAKGPEAFDNLYLPVYVYDKVFGKKLGNSYEDIRHSGTAVAIKDAVPGDIFLWETNKKVTQAAIYLGQDRFIMADEEFSKQQVPSRVNDDVKDEKDEKDEKQTDKKEKEVVPGVGVFKLQTNEDEKEKDAPTASQAANSYKEQPTTAIHFSANDQLTSHGKELIKGYAASFDFRENAATQRFIEQIGESARELGLKYDVFASVMIAQAILESGSGTSGLSTGPYYNLFGVKGSHNGASVTLATNEDNGSGQLYQINSAFRVYPSYKESLEDYVQLLRGGISGNQSFYKKVWRSEAKNYLQATSELTGKYATDTFYNNKLNSIIAVYNLTQYDEAKNSIDLNFSNANIQDFSGIPESYRHLVKYPKYNGANYNTSGSYGSDQCTWYAFNRVHQLGGTVGDYMGNGADWGTTGQRTGYKVSATPKAGDVISFKQGVAGYHPLYGHVAFVEAVGKDSILISEGDISYLNYRIIPNEIALSSGVSYITPK